MSKDRKIPHVMRQIDENLRRVYKDEQGEEIPDRFKDLLKKLKEQDRGATDER